MRTLLAGFFAVLRLVPLGLMRGAGRVMGWLAEHVVRHRRGVVEAQLALAYGATRTPPELRALRHDFYQHLGLLVMELARLPKSDPAELRARTHMQGMEHVEAALATGRGALLVTGHIGNWELAAITLAARGLPVYGLGKELKSPAGDLVRQMIRDDNGVPTIPVRRSLKEVLKVLRGNGIVAILVDQNMTREEGVFVDFFGHPCCTLATVAVLAARTGATVLLGHSYRDPDGYHHHCFVLPPFVLEAPHADASANVIHNTARMNAVLETMVNVRPAQWLWQHKRWKTRPPGELTPPIRY